MTDANYEPPKSDVETSSQQDVPEDILKKIKYGWIAAIISGVMTLLVMLISFNMALSDVSDLWISFDAVLIFVLAFGIYKKSRAAATIMFFYFLLSKILIVIETGRPTGIILSLIFLYFYFNAMTATYQYHKLIKGA